MSTDQRVDIANQLVTDLAYSPPLTAALLLTMTTAFTAPDPTTAVDDWLAQAGYDTDVDTVTAALAANTSPSQWDGYYCLADPTGTVSYRLWIDGSGRVSLNGGVVAATAVPAPAGGAANTGGSGTLTWATTGDTPGGSLAVSLAGGSVVMTGTIHAASGDVAVHAEQGNVPAPAGDGWAGTYLLHRDPTATTGTATTPELHVLAITTDASPVVSYDGATLNGATFTNNVLAWPEQTPGQPYGMLRFSMRPEDGWLWCVGTLITDTEPAPGVPNAVGWRVPVQQPNPATPPPPPTSPPAHPGVFDMFEAASPLTTVLRIGLDGTVTVDDTTPASTVWSNEQLTVTTSATSTFAATVYELDLAGDPQLAGTATHGVAGPVALTSASTKELPAKWSGTYGLTIDGDTTRLMSLIVSPDGGQVLADGVDGLFSYDETTKTLAMVAGTWNYQLVFTPDPVDVNRTIVTGDRTNTTATQHLFGENARSASTQQWHGWDILSAAGTLASAVVAFTALALQVFRTKNESNDPKDKIAAVNAKNSGERAVAGANELARDLPLAAHNSDPLTATSNAGEPFRGEYVTLNTKFDTAAKTELGKAEDLAQQEQTLLERQGELSALQESEQRDRQFNELADQLREVQAEQAAHYLTEHDNVDSAVKAAAAASAPLPPIEGQHVPVN